VLLRRSAATRLVIAIADDGDLDAADAAAREYAKNIDPGAIQHVRALRRRRLIHLAAFVALTVTLGLAVRAFVTAYRRLPGALVAIRRVAPAVTFFVVHLGLLGGYMASNYENGSPLPFVLFGALLLPLLLILRAWSSLGSARFAARLGRGCAAIAATLGLAFVVVEQTSPLFLEAVGL
jgi:hypothetical protein